MTASTPAISRLRVDIFGESCTVRGDGADPDYIAELARMVDQRMRDLAKQAPGMSRSRLAILVALNLADELMQSQSSKDESVDQSLVVQKTRQLIELLDDGIIGDSF